MSSPIIKDSRCEPEKCDPRGLSRQHTLLLSSLQSPTHHDRYHTSGISGVLTVNKGVVFLGYIPIERFNVCRLSRYINIISLYYL